MGLIPTLDAIIELTREMFGVEPLLMDGSDTDIAGGKMRICIAVTVGTDAEPNDVARREAEWNERVAIMPKPTDVFLRIDGRKAGRRPPTPGS